MSFFIVLEKESTDFDASRHGHLNVPVTSFTIEHKEGSYAKAHIHLLSQDSFDHHGWGTISQKMDDGRNVCLFRGYVETPVHGVSPVQKTLVLCAKPHNADAQIKAINKAHQSTTFYEPLFFKETDQDRDDIATLSQPVCLYCDPVSHAISLSSLFEGNKTHDVTPFGVAGTLGIKKNTNLLSHVHVTLEAQWIQHNRGLTNLSRSIRALFPDHQISTFTPSSLKKTWPKTGQTLGRSGYWVAFSKLEDITPTFDDALPASLHLWRASGARAKKCALKRLWFRGKMIVGWHLKQKRRERLTFTLTHSHQMNMDEEKSLSITLPIKRPLVPSSTQDMWTPHTDYEQDDIITHKQQGYRASRTHTSGHTFDHDAHRWTPLPQSASPLTQGAHTFFLTPRGKKAFHAAVEMAKTLVARKARAMEINLTLLPTAPRLSLNDAISITHSCVPGGHATGKIIALTRKVCASTGEDVVNVTCAVSVGTPFDAPATTLTQDSYSEDYAQDYTLREGALGTTPSQLIYPSFDDQYPQDDYAKLWSDQTTHIVRSIHIKNAPHTQHQKAQAHATQKRPLLKHNLGTEMNVRLKNLKTQDSILHTIALSQPIVWSSPQQVTLRSSHV